MRCQKCRRTQHVAHPADKKEFSGTRQASRGPTAESSRGAPRGPSGEPEPTQMRENTVESPTSRRGSPRALRGILPPLRRKRCKMRCSFGHSGELGVRGEPGGEPEPHKIRGKECGEPDIPAWLSANSPRDLPPSPPKTLQNTWYSCPTRRACGELAESPAESPGPNHLQKIGGEPDIPF